jgi:lysophospholipase L1-like esterase
VILGLGAGCSSPAAPTPPPPPPPPPPEAPTLSCGDGLSRATVNAGGTTVIYETPQAQNGQSPVTVACTPASETNFPIGTTEVSCTAPDALQRTATCTFNVTVSKLPTLSRTRFLAFGDSVTAGEVTSPGASLLGGRGATKQVLVPSASYPAVLERTLRGRYAAQAASISVFNYGLSSEKAIDARPRFISALNATQPQVVLLLEGYNDIPLGADGAASGAASEIRAMALEARRRGMTVYIATLTPGIPGRSKSIQTFLLVDYVQRMRAVAANEGAPLVDLYALMLSDASRYIGLDGLHPNEAGYARMADIFFQAIQNSFEVR